MLDVLQFFLVFLLPLFLFRGGSQNTFSESAMFFICSRQPPSETPSEVHISLGDDVDNKIIFTQPPNEIFIPPPGENSENQRILSQVK